MNKKEVGVLVAFSLKYGFKWLQKMLIRFSLLAKKAVLFAYKRRYSVLERLILIQNFVSGAISAMYNKRMTASSHISIDVLAYLPVLRSLLLKLITFQLFKHNNSQTIPLYQETNTTNSITSSYSGGFNFLSHRIQLSISKTDHRQTTDNQPPPDQQQKEHATTAQSEEVYLLMPPHNISNKNDNENNTTSTVKATMTTLPPLPKSGLDALAKYSKMDNTPRSRTKDDADNSDNVINDDDDVQHRNRGDTIPAVLFP